MPGSTARKFEEEPDDPDRTEGAIGSQDSQADEDALDDIDWSDLQDFFLTHLRGQFDEMELLFREGDAQTLSRIGHGIKGSGGGVQLPRFTDLGRDLEDSAKVEDLPRAREACRAMREEYLKHRPEDGPGLAKLFR
jgi:HPt (histidine-containing phosphotransfer) domain-containing protein